jgi:hypothetical protein
MYSDQSLCLYADGGWDTTLFLVDTIVPWTSEWLAHYELWAIDGTWYGDEPPPTSMEESAIAANPRNRSSRKREIRRRRNVQARTLPP